MVNNHGDGKSPKDRVVGPLPNGHSWLMNGGYYLLTIPGMILQAGSKNFPTSNTSTGSEKSQAYLRFGGAIFDFQGLLSKKYLHDLAVCKMCLKTTAFFETTFNGCFWFP